ncbi:hypothetical protein V8G54_010273, partial [Vigna mungo]
VLPFISKTVIPERGNEAEDEKHQVEEENSDSAKLYFNPSNSFIYMKNGAAIGIAMSPTEEVREIYLKNILHQQGLALHYTTIYYSSSSSSTYSSSGYAYCSSSWSASYSSYSYAYCSSRWSASYRSSNYAYCSSSWSASYSSYNSSKYRAS